MHSPTFARAARANLAAAPVAPAPEVRLARPSSPLHRLVLTLGTAAACAALVLIFTLPEGALARLPQLPLTWLPLPLGLVAGAWLCNAVRIRVLCGALGCPLRLRQTFLLSLAGEFGMAATPAGAGGVVTYLTLLHRAGLSYSAAAALVGAEVSLDLLCFGVFGAVGVALALGDPAWGAVISGLAPLAGPTGTAIAVVLAGAGAGFLLWRALGRHLTQRISTAPFLAGLRLGSRLRRGRRRWLRGWQGSRTAAGFLVRQRRTELAVNGLLAALQWSCRYGVLPMLLLAAGGERGLLPLFFLQAPLTLVSCAAVLPGGGGSMELVGALLLPQFVALAEVGGVLLLWRACTYYLQLFAGAAALLWLSRPIDRILPANAGTPAGAARPLNP